MLNEELKTNDGFSTTEGMRIIDPEVAKDMAFTWA